MLQKMAEATLQLDDIVVLDIDIGLEIPTELSKVQKDAKNRYLELVNKSSFIRKHKVQKIGSLIVDVPNKENPGRTLVGVMFLFFSSPQKIDEIQYSLLHKYVFQIAIAINNARHFEQTKIIADKNRRLYLEAQREVVAAQQLATLGTATAAIQHRINNTFSIIVPNVSRLRKRVDLSDETTREILDIIERNARYTSEIITRIMAPLQKYDPQTININAVLQEIINEIKHNWENEIEQPNIEFIANLDENVPPITAPLGQS